MEETAELQRETRSSIEVDRNAKGDYGYKAKVYYDETLDPTSRTAAEYALDMIDEWFQRRYRPGSKPLAPGTPDPRD